MKGLTPVTVTVPLVLPIGTSTSVTVTVPLVLPTGHGNSSGSTPPYSGRIRCTETSVPGSSREEQFFSSMSNICSRKPIMPFRQIQRLDGSHCEADPHFYFLSNCKRRVNTYAKTVYLFHSNSSTSPSHGIKTWRVNFDTKVCFNFCLNQIA